MRGANGLCLGVVLLAAHPGAAGEKLELTSCEPSQWRRGVATEFVLEGKGLASIQALELAPPEGVTLGEPVPAPSSQKKLRRWTVRAQVDGEAATGKRSLVVVTPLGRSPSLSIIIPSHLPELSDLQVGLLRAAPLAVGFTVVVRDSQSDLAEMPRTTGQVICKNEGRSMTGGGIVTERRPDGAVVVGYGVMSDARVTSGACILRVRVADEPGNSSDWAAIPVTFP